MVKAFLTNSTSYISGFMGGDNLPGNNQGWGLLNMGQALDGVPRNMIDQTEVLGTTGAATTIRGRVVDATKPFRVTLAWTDAPGTPSANPVVNNLDLQVEVNGKTYQGNRFLGPISIEGGPADGLNNLESVWLAPGVTGEYTVRVVAANITGDGVPGNADTTDQDFALVIYNGRTDTPGGPVDSPPLVNLTYPAGGERLMAGSIVSVTWTASDDKGIQSQRVEFSSDGGSSYSVIGTLDGVVRRYDWRIPAVPTTAARIKVSALDGVNLPSSSVSPANFEVIVGPPDTTPPTVAAISPNSDTVVGGGTVTTIKWREGDNVGVVRRLLELSTDGGRTFQEIASVVAPSSGDQQTFDWQVPVALSSESSKIRVTVFDGANNSSSLVSGGKFEVWPLPIITDANFVIPEDGGKKSLEVFGRKFRNGETEIYVDGRKMKKVGPASKCDEEDGTCKKITTQDKKVNKFVPEGGVVILEIRIKVTGQVSPAFEWKRKRPRQN
jgi:hypothetical protein